MGVRIVRASKRERVFVVAVMAAVELLVAISFLRALAHGSAGSLKDAWPALPFVLMTGFFAVRFCCVGLYIKPTEVIVRNMTSTSRVPRLLVVGIGIRESPTGIRQQYLVTSLGEHLPIQVLRIGPPISEDRLKRFHERHRELNDLLFAPRG